MLDLLLALHDAHDGRLRLVLSIRCDSLMRLLVLLLCLLELDLIDLDAVLRVREAQVDDELVRGIDVLASRGLGQHAVLGAGERLQRALELVVGELRSGGQLGVRHRLAVGFGVEVQHHDSLEGGEDNLLISFGEDGLHLAVRQCMLPLEFPAGVLHPVVPLEIYRGFLNGMRDFDLDSWISRPGGCGEDIDVEVNDGAAVCFIEHGLIGGILLASEFHVLEHLFEIVRETRTAFYRR